MGKTRDKKVVRLADHRDYPASRLLELSTRVSTGESFSDAFDIAERVLGDKVEQGHLLAYLFRRFGHPNKGSDPDKDLASYLLTTHRSDMLLRITPYAGGNTSISFSFLVSYPVHDACRNWNSRDRDVHGAAFLDWIETEGRLPEWAEETAEAMAQAGWPGTGNAVGWRRMMTGIAMIAHGGVKDDDGPDKAKAIRWHQSVRSDYEALHPVPPMRWRSDDVASWDDDDPRKPYAQAMERTLRDLQRPVWIRDVPIGIYGRIDEYAPKALGNAGRPAAHARSAGFPMGALGNADPEAFAEMLGAVLKLADDPAVAIARATVLLSVAPLVTGEPPRN